MGEDLATKSESELIKLRGKDISMIFQDPMTSLNPTMQIGKQVMEPLIKHKNYSKSEAKTCFRNIKFSRITKCRETF